MSEAKAQNRGRFPTIAGVVDQMREVFGPQVKVVYAKEGEAEVGDRAAHDEAKAVFEGRE